MSNPSETPAQTPGRRYLVGGAVRDALLGIPVRERDWVVVGATAEQMVEAGFQQVGKDFPVFLHPHTKDEYALARTERKTGLGYRGFDVQVGGDVSLEADLARRDLTINAIAQDEHGNLVDPYGGQSDLQNKVLRHVSVAFAEDPVRILRVARFAAKFSHLGFTIAHETMQLMKAMVAAGEVDALVPDRVWKETSRALGSPETDPVDYHPGRYFEVLHQCGALERIMPELAALDGVPQRPEHHPEVDTLIHTLMCVDAAARHGFDLTVRTATLLHDLGKAVTPKHEWPSHRQHEDRGVPLVEAFCERLRVPSALRDVAVTVTRDHLNVHRAAELRPATLHDLIERMGAFRRGAQFDQAVDACLCDARGRLGLESTPYPSADRVRKAREIALSVRADSVVKDGFTGKAVGDELRARRISEIKRTLAQQRPTASSSHGSAMTLK